MSSEFESRLSNEELKRRNLPAEPPSPATCPTPEQWTELLTLLEIQNDTMKSLLSTVQTMAAQSENQTKELLNIRQQLEQAGSKKERRRLRLPRPRLPALPTVTFKGAALTLMALAVLVILLYALATLWNVVRPLLQPLP